MTQTRWAVDGPDGTTLELGGRRFSSNDEGAPMMCNLVCTSMGRHVHIDYCRTEQGGRCDGAEVQHMSERITPDANKAKDAITHSLHWRRMGMLAILLLPRLQLSHRFQASKVTVTLPSLSQVLTLGVDPYTRDEQTNFAKWCVVLLGRNQVTYM